GARAPRGGRGGHRRRRWPHHLPARGAGRSRSRVGRALALRDQGPRRAAPAYRPRAPSLSRAGPALRRCGRNRDGPGDDLVFREPSEEDLHPVALLDIKLYGDPSPRRKASHVREVTPELRRLIGDVAETLYQQLRLELRAPQGGTPHRPLL